MTKEEILEAIASGERDELDSFYKNTTPAKWLIDNLRSAWSNLDKATGALEWYAKWDWSDKYVERIDKRAKATLKELKELK